MGIGQGLKNCRKGLFTALRRHRLGELLVSKGLITTAQLRGALSQQKSQPRPLGQIFLENSLISRKQLTFLLGRQMALRFAAGVLFFCLSMSGTKARADIADIPARIAISPPGISQQFKKVAARPGLFGTEETLSKNLKPFTKWTSMFDRFDREISRTSTQPLIRQLQNDLHALKDQDLKDMASGVNDLMNEKRYIGDNKNWGQSDYWATPVEFIQRGGDCEDFAIAKYTALRALGVPEERLRIAIVHDNVKNIPHAILAVYTDEGVYILDNQVKTLVNADGAGRYRPIFSINRTGWWLHTAPTSAPATVIASAQ